MLTIVMHFKYNNHLRINRLVDIFYQLGGDEMASIREVAKLAGVSPSTVSRVMNNTARVDEEKRKRVPGVILPFPAFFFSFYDDDHEIESNDRRKMIKESSQKN